MINTEPIGIILDNDYWIINICNNHQSPLNLTKIDQLVQLQSKLIIMGTGTLNPCRGTVLVIIKMVITYINIWKGQTW